MTEPVTYLACVRAIAAKTQQLQAALAADDWEQVLLHMEERQALMTRADALPDSARRPEEAAEAAQLMRVVLEQDRAMSRGIQAVLQSTRGEIEQSQLARQTVSAYRKTTVQNPTAMPARFVDKQR